MACGFFCWAFVLGVLAFAAACTLFLGCGLGLWFEFRSGSASGALPLGGASPRSQFIEVLSVAARSFKDLLLIVNCFSLSNHLFGFFKC